MPVSLGRRIRRIGFTFSTYNDKGERTHNIDLLMDSKYTRDTVFNELQLKAKKRRCKMREQLLLDAAGRGTHRRSKNRRKVKK